MEEHTIVGGLPTTVEGHVWRKICATSVNEFILALQKPLGDVTEATSMFYTVYMLMKTGSFYWTLCLVGEESIINQLQGVS